jgi:hypothetical protein
MRRCGSFGGSVVAFVIYCLSFDIMHYTLH